MGIVLLFYGIVDFDGIRIFIRLFRKMIFRKISMNENTKNDSAYFESEKRMLASV